MPFSADAVNRHTVLFKRRTTGFTLMELMVVIAIVAVILGMLLPHLANPPRHSPRLKCINNLKNIGLAFRIYATDHQDRFPMELSTNEIGPLESVDRRDILQFFLAMTNELSTPKLLACPEDKARMAAPSFPLLQRSNISYFVGLDVTEERPQSFLAGDRNLTTNGLPVKPGLVHLTTNAVVGWSTEIHNLCGNIAMGDGSVQQFSGARLAEALRGTGRATNRLAVP